MSILSILGLGKLGGKPKKSKSADEILAITEKKQAAERKKKGKKSLGVQY